AVERRIHRAQQLVDRHHPVGIAIKEGALVDRKIAQGDVDATHQFIDRYRTPPVAITGALGQRTVRLAAVAFHMVGVVALLGEGDDPIAAACAGIGASVTIVGIPVVALLRNGDDAVATGRARVRATVERIPVAVIALLAGRDDAITAGRARTVRVAAVTVHQVPVVALLHAGVQEAVPADVAHAGVGAGVVVILVPIVALLATGEICDTIPTN